MTLGPSGTFQVLGPSVSVAQIVCPAAPTVQITPPVQPGGSTTQVFTQASPAATWTITHSFGRLPNVTVYVGGEEVEADIDASTTTVVVTFSQPQAGSAVLQ